MEKFYLGADIGTNSVGIACTDENYKILRARGKDLWCVRLFDEANTAAERRNFRTMRRRLERRRKRISWLQELFVPYISDATFFIRLNDGGLLAEDKSEPIKGDKNTLFGGEYDDKAFHKQFPTIYHLRKALMDGGGYDLRLYYLALHHIIKYRGHFLFEGGINDIHDLSKLITDLNGATEAVFGEDAFKFDESLSAEAKGVLTDKTKGVKDKQSGLKKIFGAIDKVTKEIIKGICGGKISPSAIFGDEYKEEKSFSFKDLTDETFASMESVYGDDFIVLSAIRAIYNFVTFEKLLSGYEDISSAMIAIYEKHKSDLKKLKTFVKNETPDEYNRIFKSTKESANYVNYIGYTKKGGDKKKVEKCKDEDFYAYVKKYLNSLCDVKNEEARFEMLADIERGEFMPKILHSDGGLFPRQVNEAELAKIAENMVMAHPETAAVKDKLLPLFRYKIPYYVGPLAGKNSWAVRKEGEITPWNFNDKIDLAASNEEFMRRMTNKCSYLRGEDVLPKASMIYQKFDVLNQLNKLKYDGRALSVELKQKIFNELFTKYQKVSDKKIIELLIREGKISPNEKAAALTGKDGDLKASMSSYIRFKKILGDFVDTDEGFTICEKIILWHTLNTDKSVVEDLIKKNYGGVKIIKDNLKVLKGLTFNDFGRLSEKFLTGLIVPDKSTGEMFSILDALYETNENLNELLFDERFDFMGAVKEENGECSEEVTLKDVEELYVSPAVRRGIWQSLTVIDEYVAAIGKSPDKIFVEVTREDGVKGDAGRKLSRKIQLAEKFKGIEQTYSEIAAEFNSDTITDMRLRQERLYLYFRQLGRCMYTGERINLGQINDATLYDVDHILPRTYIKDDSLDNKVLVLRSANAEKSDTYPVPDKFRKQSVFWKMLLDKTLISRTTYDRLMRTAPLTDDDYSDFINRQKVITDQTAKAVAELLERKYPNTKIVYSKAKNVNDFKQEFKIFKCRETNDLHHARDAYLNVVVGNVYDTVFSTPMSMFRQDGDKWRAYNLKNLFKRDAVGAWNVKSSIETVKNTLKKPSMTITQYAFSNKADFYKQTVCGKGDSAITAPRKGAGALSDASKYGGYKGQSTAYFAIVSSVGKKGEAVKYIEAVPVLTTYQAKSDDGAVQKYFESYLKNPVILVPKVKIRQLVSFNGTLCYLAGITDNRIIAHNANQLFTDNKTDEYVNALLKIVEMQSKNMLDLYSDSLVIKTNSAGDGKLVVDKDKNLELYQRLTNKLNEKIYSGISAFSTFKNNLLNGEEKFAELELPEQAKVIIQILKFFKCNAETSDLTSIGGAKGSGSIKFNKNITDVDFRLINRSPAGLTEKVHRV